MGRRRSSVTKWGNGSHFFMLVDTAGKWVTTEEIAPPYTSESWVLFTDDDGTDEAREVETFFWVWVSALGERQG